MHEFGYVDGILESILQRAAGRPVKGAKIRAGEAHRLDVAALEQAFMMVSSGTAAEGIALTLEVVPGDELTLESIDLQQPAEGA